jgi:hypothetical protein
MTQQTIDLALPRTITMAINGRRLDYTFAPITRTQWFEYFSRIISSSERRGNEVVEEFDTTDARLTLVTAALPSYEVCRAACLGNRARCFRCRRSLPR